jgi:hypothetical protein
MRRHFHVLKEDLDYLNSQSGGWESVVFHGSPWIFIYDYLLPDGYIPQKTVAAVEMATGYPRAQLDMIYFHPAVTRVDSMPIAAVSQRQIDGKVFQQWSRHRTTINPWREGIDSLSSHMALAEYWLEREFKIRPRAVQV